MGLMNGIGAGLSAMGGGIAQFAETAGLQQQKEALEEQQIKLSSQLSGQPITNAENLFKYNQLLDAYGLPPATQADLNKQNGNLSSGGTSQPGNAAGATSSASSGSASNLNDASDASSGGAFNQGGAAPGGATISPSGSSAPAAQDQISGMIRGILRNSVVGIQPTDLQRSLLTAYQMPPGPQRDVAMDAVTKAAGINPYMGGDRAGVPLRHFNPESGKYEVGPDEFNTMEAGAAAGAKGSSEGALPAEITKIAATAGQARQTASFQKGLDLATNLVDSYDPATQTTTKITQADALKRTRAGNGIITPPPNAPVVPSAADQPGLKADGSYKTLDGYVIPPAPKVVGGKGLQTGPSAADKATQDAYAPLIKGWADSVEPSQLAEQRFTAIADAMKATQTGAWQETKQDIAKKLISYDLISPDDAKTLLGSDVGQAQIILKNNFGAALNTMASTHGLSRFTQNELFATQKNLPAIGNQPEANLAMIGQAIGTARWQQGLANGWNSARQMGYADPLAYQEAWTKANPLQKSIDAATKEIGPLKGMTPAQVQLPAMKDREVGKTYPTPTGPHIWMGNGWAPAGQDQQAP